MTDGTNWFSITQVVVYIVGLRIFINTLLFHYKCCFMCVIITYSCRLGSFKRNGAARPSSDGVYAVNGLFSISGAVSSPGRPLAAHVI